MVGCCPQAAECRLAIHVIHLLFRVVWSSDGVLYSTVNGHRLWFGAANGHVLIVLVDHAVCLYQAANAAMSQMHVPNNHSKMGNKPLVQQFRATLSRMATVQWSHFLLALVVLLEMWRQCTNMNI